MYIRTIIQDEGDDLYSVNPVQFIYDGERIILKQNYKEDRIDLTLDMFKEIEQLINRN